MPSKADLHLHSRHSDRPPSWLLRKLNVPESHSDPAALYKTLMDRGMQFFTLTDHNTINGCLEIADRPGVFLSEEVTTFFPEDRCAVELLIWGITEAQHCDIQSLRENVYELRRYLAQQQIVHAVAHPFYRREDQLQLSHIEKLVLLFRHFEGLNGLRDQHLNEATRALLSELTPKKIEELANRHNLEPAHPTPWEKVFIGGSDDHSGLFAGCCYTETPRSDSPQAFLAQVEAGRCIVGGRSGTPLSLAHAIYSTLFNLASEKLQRSDGKPNTLFEKIFARFREGRDPTDFTLTEKIGMVTQGILSGKILDLAKPSHASLWKPLSATLTDADLKLAIAHETNGVEEPERRAFIIANLFVSKLAQQFGSRFVEQLRAGSPVDAFQDLTLLAPILFTLAPYFYAFRTQATPRKWLREVSTALCGKIITQLENNRRAWFTDTLVEINGVATTIQKMAAAARTQQADLTIVTSTTQATEPGVKNFPPLGEFELPEYEFQKLSIPPILEVIDYIQRERFTELVISTPGPLGLTALFAGRLLGIRTVGIYHTDFPRYVRILTEDAFMEGLTWKFMHAFYSRMDLVYVNSEAYRHEWQQRGIPAERLRILPRGLDLQLFHPCRRRANFWKASPVLLYVGRISKEKDLHLIVEAAKRLKEKGVSAHFAFVGDGPYLEELRQLLPEATFTGILNGLELAAAYASADLFLFPSTTDTYGNVVVEAHASGLPTIVSNTGGPKDLVMHGHNGLVTQSLSVESFTTAIETLLNDRSLLKKMGENARRSVEQRDWSRAFKAFWEASPI